MQVIHVKKSMALYTRELDELYMKWLSTSCSLFWCGKHFGKQHASLFYSILLGRAEKLYCSARSQVPDRVPEVTIFYFVCRRCDISSLLPPTSFHLRWHKVICPPTWFPPTQSLIAWQLWLGSCKFALKSQHLRMSAREFYTLWMIEALFDLYVSMTSI